MKIVGRERLAAFCDKHADVRQWTEHWLSEVEAARWATSQDIRARYASASFLAGNVVIFNVKGNRYRLELRVAYATAVVVVIWIGTHADYEGRNRER
jgi:mRNA interferase HigB